METAESKYGLIINDSDNIGDDIQSIAALQFLPKIDSYYVRDRIGRYNFEEETKIILNAWWMDYPYDFPTNALNKPKLVSLHLTEQLLNKIKNSPQIIDFLVENGPVGARDINTLNQLNKLDIPAYYSGCLTLTLTSETKLPKMDYILLVDVPQNIVDEIRKITNRKIIETSNKIPTFFDSMDRLEFAKLALRRFQQAHFVITTKLHVSMPCLSLETPVLLLLKNDKDPRFSGLRDLVNWVESDKALPYINSVNFEAPPSNPNTYLVYRKRLIDDLYKFTGYYSGFDNWPINNLQCEDWSSFNYFGRVILDFFKTQNKRFRRKLSKL
jgi:hypothetical protein